MIRLPIFIIVWIAFLAIKIPTVLLGAFVIPVMWRYRDIDYNDLPWWTRPFANPEDWRGGPQHFANCLPEWWVRREGDGFWSFWKYHAIRNPANGLRSFEFLDLDPDPAKIKYKATRYLRYYEPWYARENTETQTYGYIAWQGFRAGVKFVHHWNDKRHFVFKFGWRIEPRDAHELLDSGGVRIKDAGFATKLLFYREG